MSLRTGSSEPEFRTYRNERLRRLSPTAIPSVQLPECQRFSHPEEVPMSAAASLAATAQSPPPWLLMKSGRRKYDNKKFRDVGEITSVPIPRKLYPIMMKVTVACDCKG